MTVCDGCYRVKRTSASGAVLDGPWWSAPEGGFVESSARGEPEQGRRSGLVVQPAQPLDYCAACAAERGAPA